ncbi:MAG: hypothetical protein OER96_08935 [Gammaproteobacteria bacterium]|nr:hypothetical protein [Gammaproteobacteria bacterium]
MSIALAVRKNNKIVLATDSLTTFGSLKVDAPNFVTTKVMKHSGSLITGTGWSKYDDILDDYLATKKSAKLDSPRVIFNFFHELWTEMHKRYSFVNDQSDDKESPFGSLDSSFLVVNGAGIFHISSNMSITKFEQYIAIGSGQDYALGVLFALYSSRASAETVAKNAVLAAINFDIYCGGKVNVFSIKQKK